MPLQEGQILEAEDYTFVLVRADKNSRELIAVQMDILLGQDSPSAALDVDDDLYLRNIDISNVTAEDLLKTSNLDLESLNTPAFTSDVMLNSTEIDSIAKELIDDVIASTNSVETTDSCLIDISNFTAKEFFDAQNFNFDHEFQENSGSIDIKFVKMPIQVQPGQELLVIEPVSFVAEDILLPQEPVAAPIIERRMPKFNKRTKLIAELREFEAQLQNIRIARINEDQKTKSKHKRKQDFQKFVNNLDTDVSFYSDQDIKEVKTARKPRGTRKTNPKKPKNEKIVYEIETDSSEDSAKTLEPYPEPKIADPVLSLRCHYCQKMFITNAGLNSHMKQCAKLDLKLSELIEESCGSPINVAGSAEMTLEEASMDITTTPIRKNVGRSRKKLL